MKIVGKDIITPTVNEVVLRPPRSIHYNRNLFMSAAHLLGASFRQLARLYQISPASVIQAVDKMIPVALRSKSRLDYKMSLERLSQHQANFVQHQLELTEYSPGELAQWLARNLRED